MQICVQCQNPNLDGIKECSSCHAPLVEVQESIVCEPFAFEGIFCVKIRDFQNFKDLKSAYLEAQKCLKQEMYSSAGINIGKSLELWFRVLLQIKKVNVQSIIGLKLLKDEVNKNYRLPPHIRHCFGVIQPLRNEATHNRDLSKIEANLLIESLNCILDYTKLNQAIFERS